MKKRKKRTIKLRNISKEEAKIEIEQLFQKHDILFYSDITKKLKLDLEFVVTVCNELINENMLEVAEEKDNTELAGGVFPKVLKGTQKIKGEYRYWCTKCNKIHTNASKIYKDHLSYKK